MHLIYDWYIDIYLIDALFNFLSVLLPSLLSFVQLLEFNILQLSVIKPISLWHNCIHLERVGRTLPFLPRLWSRLGQIVGKALHVKQCILCHCCSCVIDLTPRRWVEDFKDTRLLEVELLVLAALWDKKQLLPEHLQRTLLMSVYEAWRELCIYTLCIYAVIKLGL